MPELMVEVCRSCWDGGFSEVADLGEEEVVCWRCGWTFSGTLHHWVRREFPHD